MHLCSRMMDELEKMKQENAKFQVELEDSLMEFPVLMEKARTGESKAFLTLKKLYTIEVLEGVGTVGGPGPAVAQWWGRYMRVRAWLEIVPTSSWRNGGALWTRWHKRGMDEDEGRRIVLLDTRTSLHRAHGGVKRPPQQPAQPAVRQLLGPAHAQTTPQGTPAAAAVRTQRPDAAREGRLCVEMLQSPTRFGAVEHRGADLQGSVQSNGAF